MSLVLADPEKSINIVAGGNNAFHLTYLYAISDNNYQKLTVVSEYTGLGIMISISLIFVVLYLVLCRFII